MTREEAIRVLKDTYAHWLRLKDEDILPCSECEKVTEAIDMAIEALSAEAVHKPDYSYEADMVRRLKESRSADAVQGWIPCSDRLPKAEDMYQPPEQRYLCQLEAYGEKKFCVLSRLKGAVSPFWDWYGVAVHDSEVIAWMPLPKPYRKDGEEE